MRIIMTALAPLECRHPRLGQSLWRLGVMRPQCLHAHAAPAGVLVCPAGRPGEVSLPSVASSPCARVCVCVCVCCSFFGRPRARFLGSYMIYCGSDSVERLAFIHGNSLSLMNV